MRHSTPHNPSKRVVDDHAAAPEESIPDTLRVLAPEDVARAALSGAADDLGHAEVCALLCIAELLKTRTQEAG